MNKALVGDVTWKSEFYFLASLIDTPRYIASVDQPHNLFGNKDLLTVEGLGRPNDKGITG